jgi:hypothetical protein
MTKILAPLVDYDKLKSKSQLASINVGTKAWFDWLEENTSFHYESTDGKFTACKESRASGMFWYANRRVNGKLRRCYMGSTKDLSLEKLLVIARKLSGIDLSYQSEESYTQDSCVTKTGKADRAAVEQLKEQVADLQKQLDHERIINAALQTDIDLTNVKIYQLHKHYVVRLKDLEAAGYHLLHNKTFEFSGE